MPKHANHQHRLTTCCHPTHQLTSKLCSEPSNLRSGWQRSAIIRVTWTKVYKPPCILICQDTCALPRSHPLQPICSFEFTQQQSGRTPVVGLEHTSAIDHSSACDDQPPDTAEHSLGSTSTQPSPNSTPFARAGSHQHMHLHPGPRSMQSQAGSAKEPCRLAHDGPVHEIVVLSDRVVTRGGREQSLVMKEWTAKGELVETHSTCKQGQHIAKLILLALLSCLHPLQTRLCCSRQRCRHHNKEMDYGFFRSLFGIELVAKGQTHTSSSNQWCHL